MVQTSLQSVVSWSVTVVVGVCYKIIKLGCNLFTPKYHNSLKKNSKNCGSFKPNLM